MIAGKFIGCVVTIEFRTEERLDGIELKNNLFEPKFIGYDNQNVCN